MVYDFASNWVLTLCVNNKSKFFAEVPFRKTLDFYYRQNTTVLA